MFTISLLVISFLNELELIFFFISIAIVSMQLLLSSLIILFNINFLFQVKWLQVLQLNTIYSFTHS